MHAGHLGRFHYLFRVDLVETGDVLADAAFEQLDVLRQVADVWAKGLLVPAGDIGTVEADHTVLWGPDAHQGTHQRGFTGGTWADDADDGTGRGHEADAADDRGLGARRGDDQVFDLNVAFWGWKRHALRFVFQVVHHFAEAVVLDFGSDEAFPAADHLVDGGQRAAQQQGTCHQKAGVDFVRHYKIRTNGQHDGLRPDTECFGGRADHAAFITRIGLKQHDVALTLGPPVHQGIKHPHRLDDLGITQGTVGHHVGGDVLLVGLSQRAASRPMIDDRQHGQHRAAEQRHPAEPWVEQEHHDGVDGEPRGIEKCEKPWTCKELAQRSEVVKGLRRSIGAAAIQGALEACPVHIAAEHDIQAVTDTHHDARTYPLQGTHGRDQHSHDQREHEQSGGAAGGHHATRYLDHEERGHQHQCVDEETKEAYRKEAAFAGSKGGLQSVFGLITHGVRTEEWRKRRAV